MKLKILFIALISHLSLNAQNDSIANTKEYAKNLGVSLNSNISTIYGNTAYFLEGNMVYKIHPKFNIGLFSFGFYSYQKIIESSTKKQSLYGYASGVLIEPVMLENKSFIISLPIKFGLGAIGYTNDSLNNIIQDQDINTPDWDPFQLWEFGASFTTPRNKTLQFISTLSYRTTNRFELIKNKTKSISGFSIGIGLRWYFLTIKN